MWQLVCVPRARASTWDTHRDRNSVWRSLSMVPSHEFRGVPPPAMSSQADAISFHPRELQRRGGFCSGSRSSRVIYRGIICLDVNNLGLRWQRAGGQLPCLLHSCTFAAWGDPLGSQGDFLGWILCSPIPLPILGPPCTLLGVFPHSGCPTPSLRIPDGGALAGSQLRNPF